VDSARQGSDGQFFLKAPELWRSSTGCITQTQARLGVRGSRAYWNERADQLAGDAASEKRKG
jgi:hypothetical protein